MTQNSRITIRSACRTDLPSLYAISAMMKNEEDSDYFERCLEMQKEGSRIILVAALDNEDCGYCTLNWRPKYGFYQRLGIAEIQDVNVIPEMRRQGVASALIAYCENIAREKDHEQIGISFGLDRPYGPAQRLYIRLGYIPDGQGVTYDRQPVEHGQSKPIDDDLCLMLVKGL